VESAGLDSSAYGRRRDAQSALAIVESGVAVDLLFTDVMMPYSGLASGLPAVAPAEINGEIAQRSFQS